MNTKAKRVLKLDAGHWTIVERSIEVAQALESHWASAKETTEQVKGEQP